MQFQADRSYSPRTVELRVVYQLKCQLVSRLHVRNRRRRILVAHQNRQQQCWRFCITARTSALSATRDRSVSDALVLTVPCDFGYHKPQEVTTYIMDHLREFLGGRGAGIFEHMTILQILSKNRNLEAQIKEAEHMLAEIDR